MKHSRHVTFPQNQTIIIKTASLEVLSGISAYCDAQIYMYNVLCCTKKYMYMCQFTERGKMSPPKLERISHASQSLG